MQYKGVKVEEAVTKALDKSLSLAESAYNAGVKISGIPSQFQNDLLELSNASNSASAVFNNIITCLAIKVAFPDIDIRYHQVAIQKPPKFNFRGISEKTVYPWLQKHSFEGAKSGWQTRTLERPKPYMLEYDEKIARVKEPFLQCFYQIEDQDEDALKALTYLFYEQIGLREKKKVKLAIPTINDISVIKQYFQSHFFSSYKSKGAARLPVLAIYSIYYIISDQLARYEDKNLDHLEEHSAADSQTGAVGDIQFRTAKGSIFEAIEIKHNIVIDENLVNDCADKIMDKTLDRYYILTTHPDCKPDNTLQQLLDHYRRRIGCQIIVNGVVDTISYYLRLIKEPSEIFPVYAKLLQGDTAISHEHREAWNNVVLK